jgi:hypothetical protein
MTYKAIQNPSWKLKESHKHLSLPQTVSCHGSLPSMPEAYERVYRPSIEINDRGRITYSNYFCGKILQTFEEAMEIAQRLNKN